MLSSKQVLDTYYLEARRDLLELAALLDRHDAAVAREPSAPTADDEKLLMLRRALAHLADKDAPNNRARHLLEMFSEI
ncbi:MAG: hypothetical protein ACPGIA_01570 [Luteolibacter sp.]